jgi:hypothetical protein
MTVPGTLARPRSPETLLLDSPAARRSLRGQIARLERRLVGSGPLSLPGSRGLAPRLLSLGELERARDGLLDRLAVAQAAGADVAAAQAAARARVEAMLADPAAHRWERVTREELGEPGCGDWHVRPRLGLLGLLMDWWVVKLSSGCPLAMADKRNRRPENPVLEMALTLLVLAVLVGTVLVFLFVYHDFPLRTS